MASKMTAAMDEDVFQWLQVFVDSEGEDKAQFLLSDAGRFASLE
jgi:hypothetical protein